MNECEQSERLSAYHDGEMPSVAREEMESHLRQCPRCAAELVRIKKLSALLSGMGEGQLSRSSLEGMHRRVDKMASRGIVRLAEAFSAVAAMIVVACVIGLARQAPAQASTAATDIWETQVLVQQTPESAAAGSDDLPSDVMLQNIPMEGDRD